MSEYYPFDKKKHIQEYQNPTEEVTRFIEAQNRIYCYDNGEPINYHQLAVREFKSGCKQEHYIWYILPQLEFLGKSSYSKKYGIPGLKGAIEYLRNDLLRTRLFEVVQALLDLETDDLLSVMSQIDVYKTRSSVSLFFLAARHLYGEESPEAEFFLKMIKKYFSRIGLCTETLSILFAHGEIKEDEMYL